MEAVWVALIVAGVGLLGQWLLKRQDFARQDEVATRLAKQNELVVTATEVTNAKLEQVHKIVNQQRTDMLAYQATLLAALRAAGVDVPPDESLNHPAGLDPAGG